MRNAAAGFAFLLLLGVGHDGPAPMTPASETMTIQSITPLLYVEEIEPLLPFWVDRLGFEKSTEVPHGDRLGFVILTRDDVQLMVQTRASVADDVGPLADTPMGGTLLFIVVDDLDAIARALEGIEPVVPRRTTFYGADELIVREPGGNVVTFAQFGEAESDPAT